MKICLGAGTCGAAREDLGVGCTPSADALRFDRALLAEVNSLRQDPQGYGNILLRDGKVGFPYIDPTDTFFPDESSTNLVFESDLIYLHLDSGNVGVADFETLDNGYRSVTTPLPPVNSSGNNCTKSLISQDIRGRAGVAAELVEGMLLYAVRLARHCPNLFPLAKYSRNEMTLDEIKEHLSRHSLYRCHLEEFRQQTLCHWQVARRAQRQLWSAEDERHTRKVRKNISVRKKSTPQNLQDSFEQRRRVCERIDHFFASRLAILEAEINMEYVCCKRLVNGANLILDSVRALKASEPAPCLRLSCGLTLAAQHAGRVYHGDRHRALQLRDMHVALHEKFHVTNSEETVFSQLPSATKTDRSSTRASCSSAEDGGGAFDSSSLCRVKGADNGAVIMTNAARADRSGAELAVSAQHLDVCSDESELVSCALSEARSLAGCFSYACDIFGHVGGDVRGVQTYGCIDARTVVMSIILGVDLSMFAIGAEKAIADGVPSTVRGDDGVLLCEQGTSDVTNATAFPYDHDGSKVMDGGWTAVFEGRTRSACHAARWGKEYLPRMYAPGFALLDSRWIAAACMYSGVLILPTDSDVVRQVTLRLMHTVYSQSEKKDMLKRQPLSNRSQSGIHLLLWKDAHLLGCCWQRISGMKNVPTYDQREEYLPPAHSEESLQVGPAFMRVHTDNGASDHGTVLVSTILTLTPSFDDLAVIQHWPDTSTDEAQRLAIADFTRRASAYVVSNDFTRSACIDTQALVSSSRFDSVNGREDGSGVVAIHRSPRLSRVCLHSSLSAALIFPTSHPFLLSRSEMVACAVLRASAQRVDIQACVTAEDTCSPTFIVVDVHEVLVQRSDVDIDVVIVLVDVRSVLRRTRTRTFSLHFYECDKVCSVERGFVHVGFVRFALESDRCPDYNKRFTMRGDIGARDGGGGHQIVDANCDKMKGAAVICRDAPLSVKTGDSCFDCTTRTTMMSYSGGGSFTTNPIIAKHMKPYVSIPGHTSSTRFDFSDCAIMPDRTLSGRDDTNRMILSLPGDLNMHVSHLDLTRPHAASSVGWPRTTLHFHERCATLLSPLSTIIRGDGGPVRIAIVLPRCPAYLAEQVEALRQAVRRHSSDEDVQHDQHASDERQEKIHELPSRTTSGVERGCDNSSESNLCTDCISSDKSRSASIMIAHVVTTNKTRGQACEGAGKTPLTPTDILHTTDQEAKSCAMKSNTNTDVNMARRTKSCTKMLSLSCVPENEIPRESIEMGGQSSMPPPLETHPHKSSDTSQIDHSYQVKSLSLPNITKTASLDTMASVDQLHYVATKMARIAAKCRSRFVAAENAARTEIDAITKDAAKSKGREQERLNFKKKVILDKLHNMGEKVESVEKEANLAADEVARRERDKVLRKASLKRARNELHNLLTRVNRCTPLSVKLWLASGSVLPAISTSTTKVRSYEAAPNPKFIAMTTAGEWCDVGVHETLDVNTPHSFACSDVIGNTTHSHFDNSNMVTLTPVNKDLTRYESVFTVPDGFDGQAILLVDGYECVRWRVIRY